MKDHQLSAFIEEIQSKLPDDTTVEICISKVDCSIKLIVDDNDILPYGFGESVPYLTQINEAIIIANNI